MISSFLFEYNFRNDYFRVIRSLNVSHIRIWINSILPCNSNPKFTLQFWYSPRHLSESYLSYKYKFIFSHPFFYLFINSFRFLDIQHHVRQWQKFFLYYFSIRCVTNYLHHVIQAAIDLSLAKAMQLQFYMQVKSFIN